MGGIRRIYEQHYWQTWLKIQRERQTLLEQRAVKLDIEQAFFKAKHKQCELEERYNHNHDPRTGRFVSNNSLTESGNSDKMFRKKKNTGAFSSLTVPMQMRAVKRICSSYDIDISDIEIKIQRNEHLIGTIYYGSADHSHIGRIDLFPNAFADEEQLIRTVIHEKTHVSQLRKYGKEFCEKNLSKMESEAYAAEDSFIGKLKKG